MRQTAYYLFCFLIFLISCVNIDDQSNETIPNYSITITDYQQKSNAVSNVIISDDNTYLIATETIDSSIVIVQVEQNFNSDEWQLSLKEERVISDSKLFFFKEFGEDDYLLGYVDFEGQLIIEHLDSNLEVINERSDYLSYIDTAYNQVESFQIEDLSYSEEREEILLAGNVKTQGTIFSCVLVVSSDLAPLRFLTYFENSTATGIQHNNRDTFLLINSDNITSDTDLIIDNHDRSVYQKYDLSFDELFVGNQAYRSRTTFSLTGVRDGVGQLIEVNLESASAFVNEVEIYPVINLQGVFLERDSSVLSGVQQEGSGSYQWISELGDSGSLWCHRFIDERYQTIQAVNEMPGKGISVLATIERYGNYFLHLTRIDEEGATFISQYTENCL